MFLRVLTLPATVYRNRKRLSNQPRFLTYTVTFACNARCIMCDSWKIKSQDDLNLDEISRIFAQLPPMDAIRLTGGEPFVRRDLAEIARLVQRYLRPLLTHITTNGLLTDRITEFCESRSKRRPLQLLISVDGVGDKHNQIRGSSHAWSSVIKTIKELAPRQKELGIHLGVNQTIVDAEGIEHYKMLREILRPYQIYNNIVMAYDASATYNMEREIDVAPTEVGQFTTFGDISKEGIRDLLAAAEADLHELPWTERWAKRYYLRGIRNRLLNDCGEPNPQCVALNSHLRIFPNGDVPTCQFNTKIVGNLRERRFSDVWDSATTHEQRTWVRNCPGCWAECEVIPNALYTLDWSRAARSKSRDIQQV